MGLAISGLNAVETPAVTDVLEVEQSTGSAKATIQQIDDLVFSDTTDLDATILPIEGDIAAYDGSVLEPNAEPRWRVIPSTAYNSDSDDVTLDTTNGISVVGFTGGEAVDGVYMKASDYVGVGDPVRVVSSAVGTKYGVCVAVTETELTIQGSGITYPASTLTSIAVGSKDMVKHVRLVASGTSYDSGVVNVAKGCVHVWNGPTAWVAAVFFSHMTVASNLPSLQLVVNSSTVTNPVEIPAGASGTVYGDWVCGKYPRQANPSYDLNDGDVLRVKVETAGGTPSDYLICCVTLVVP